MSQTFRKRLTAIKIPISELLIGKMVSTESYPLFETNLGDLKRVRVMGQVVGTYHSEKPGKKAFTILNIDDGTGCIALKAWGREALEYAVHEKGATLDVIGIIRVDTSGLEEVPFINPELVLPVVDPTWELVRRLEIVQQYKRYGLRPPEPSVVHAETQQEVQLPPISDMANEEEEVDNLTPDQKNELEAVKTRLIPLIQQLDSGKGAEYTALQKTIDHPLFEEALMALLTLGVAYEPASGYYKILV